MQTDEVIERHQTTFYCDKCHANEYVVYDAVVGGPLLDIPVYDLEKDWRSVPQVIRRLNPSSTERLLLDFCSQDCEDAYFSSIRGNSMPYRREKESTP